MHPVLCGLPFKVSPLSCQNLTRIIPETLFVLPWLMQQLKHNWILDGVLKMPVNTQTHKRTKKGNNKIQSKNVKCNVFIKKIYPLFLFVLPLYFSLLHVYLWLSCLFSNILTQFFTLEAQHVPFTMQSLSDRSSFLNKSLILLPLWGRWTGGHHLPQQSPSQAWSLLLSCSPSFSSLDKIIDLTFPPNDKYPLEYQTRFSYKWRIPECPLNKPFFFKSSSFQKQSGF